MKGIIFSLLFFCGSVNATDLFVTDSVGLGYMPYLQNLSPIPLVHSGACSYPEDPGVKNPDNAGSSQRIAACINGWLSINTYGKVYFNAGLHDVHIAGCAKGAVENEVPLSDYLMNLQTIIDTIRAYGTTPVFITTTPVKGRVSCHYEYYIEQYNAAAVELMQSQGIQVIDLFSDTLPIQGYLHGDQGIHFEPYGYDFLAHRVLKLSQN